MEIGNDTTAKIVAENKVLWHSGGYAPSNFYYNNKENGGATVIYKLDVPTNILEPAGIIPTSGNVIERGGANIFVFRDDKIPFNYVNENTWSSGYSRWAQDVNNQMREFSSQWTLSEQYFYIQFSVDIRYLDKAYMYDVQSGQVFFAGKNTIYYGHRNISELN